MGGGAAGCRGSGNDTQRMGRPRGLPLPLTHGRRSQVELEHRDVSLRRILSKTTDCAADDEGETDHLSTRPRTRPGAAAAPFRRAGCVARLTPPPQVSCPPGRARFLPTAAPAFAGAPSRGPRSPTRLRQGSERLRSLREPGLCARHGPRGAGFVSAASRGRRRALS